MSIRRPAFAPRSRSPLQPHSWQLPSGLDAYPVLKELRPVGEHAICSIWENDLAPAVHAFLADQNVRWTSTDLVRIGKVGGRSAPVVLWIGVEP